MGRKRRFIPLRLGEKLKAVREHLNLSQSEMLALIKPDEDRNNRAVISEYERGVKAPGCIGLLLYARLGKVSTDVLIDDELQLRLPSDDERQSARQDPSAAASCAATSCGCISLAPRLPSGEREALTVCAHTCFLDLLDDLYLDLLRATPRSRRPPLTKDFFCQALIAAAVADYLEYTDAETLVSGWQRLTNRRRRPAADG